MSALRVVFGAALLAIVGCGAQDAPRPDATLPGSGASPDAPPSPEQIAQRTFPGVVLLAMQDAAAQLVSLGSGFFVAPGVVATNFHVIREAAGGTVRLVGQEGTHGIVGTVALNPEHDLALLKVDGVQGTPLQLSAAAQPVVGASVFAVGNPQGLEGTFSPGIVSAIRKLDDFSLLQITAPISPGSSGGPVVDSEGNVVGIATATFTGGQDLNFAVPTAALVPLLDSVAAAPRPLAGRAPRRSTLLDRLESQPSGEAVVGDRLQWAGEFDFQSEYSLSLRNKLQQSVRNVVALVIFYDADGEPLETDLVTFMDIIPPGLARRASGQVEPAVKRMTTRSGSGGTVYRGSPHTRVEVRVLDYQVVQ